MRSAILAALSAVMILSRPVYAGKSEKPNIVIIYADDLEYEDLGAYGGKVLTPNIDKIAERGVKFNRAYVSSAVCTPSRYSILTGRYASRSRSLEKEFPKEKGGMATLMWNTYLTQGDRSIPAVLQENGYRTGMAGKWDQSRPHMEKVPADGNPEDPEVAKIVEKNYQNVVAEVKTHGFDFAGAIYRNNMPWMPLPDKLREHNQEWVTDAALKFIDESADKPFFLYVAPTIPHWPSSLTALESDPRYTVGGVLDKAPDVQRSREDLLAAAKEAGMLNWKKAGLMWLDDAVGAIYKKLDEKGVRNNTLVFFISDNRTVSGKMTCYESARVPWMAEWPGVIPAGIESDKLVSNVDLGTTIFKMAGVKNRKSNTQDGKNILPALSGKKYTRKDLFLEVGYSRAVVTEDGWKYLALRFPEDKLKAAGGKLNHEGTPPKDVRWKNDEANPAYYDFDQLYNLNEDPEEQVNLAANPKHAKRLKKLKKRLRAYSKDLPYSYAEFSPGR